jgi:mono/diheme cytochrome c family protein
MLLIVLAFAGAMAGCATADNEAEGFRLARRNASVHRGKAAFVEFGCTNCHAVTGSTQLPSPTLQRVTLGGSVLAAPSDGYIVTAIINPAYHATRYPVKDSEGGQRMPEFESRMTVRQLTDIVTYLKSRYSLAPVAVPPEFP